MNGLWHKVADGQDLLFLAEWYYGSSMMWSHLYYANLDLYGDDFEKIPAGSKVFIPALEADKTEITFIGDNPREVGERIPIVYRSREGSLIIGQEATGEKYMILEFTGEGQEVD